MAFFATPYTIHFDDTMAYQSHHFLTSFKFQCEARESLLYGDLIFDLPGVPEALDSVHLFTADAYSRNLKPAFLGDRLVVLLSLEEWGVVSARFCYRVLNLRGEAICAGFQTHVCANPKTGQPTPLPDPLQTAFDKIRHITELPGPRSFRDQVLAGGDHTTRLFTPEVRELAIRYLKDRYSYPQIVFPASNVDDPQIDHQGSSNLDGPKAPTESETPHTNFQNDAKDLLGEKSERDFRSKGIHVEQDQEPEVWIFPGQGAFDVELLSQRISWCLSKNALWRSLLDECAALVQNQLCIDGIDALAFLSGHTYDCRSAILRVPELSQIGIFLQGVLGAELRGEYAQPAILLGHSLGEIAALTVAGSLSLLDGVLAVCERILAIREFGPRDGKLLAVFSDRTVIGEEIAVAGLADVVIAGRNHNGQTIVSGPADQLSKLCTRMRELQIRTHEISSPTSFHHPILKPAANAWRRQLQQITFSPPAVTVYSPIGRRMFERHDDFATILSTQLVRPFDLQGAIDDLALAGFTRLVDCGSSGVLLRLLRDIVPAGMQVTSVDRLGPPVNDSTSPNSKFPVAEKAKGQMTPATQSVTRTSSEAIFKKDLQESTPLAVEVHVSKTRPSIAIVGQGCLLPGGANSPEALYAALMKGQSGIVDLREIDPHWERDFYKKTLQPDRSTSALAGIVNERDIVAPPNVDVDFFETLSRAQKLFCVAIAPCLHLIKEQERILFMVGATADGFQDQDRVAALRYTGMETTTPEIVARLGEKASAWQDPYTSIRYVIDRLIHTKVELRLIDAACASSLYSVALGMLALENNEVDIVLAGGVYCPGPGNNCLFSQFGGLTASGCRPFDATADGVVFSEGAAMVALRRLSDSQKLGQPAEAIVRGFGISSDGRSPSANVPQSSGQLIALRRCYENYNLSPSSISGIEGHGTATPAGDSTEIQSLTKFFSEFVSAPLPLHSLKGLLGHAGWAAGSAAMIAVTQMFKARTFPAQATFKTPSATLSKSCDVLYVPTQPLRLSEPGCRIAIDGFGFGGANAHLVLEAIDASENSAIAPIAQSPESSESLSTWQDLVVVAQCEVNPKSFKQSTAQSNTRRFDRRSIPLPSGAIVLPDLDDDMDITHRLMLHLTNEALTQLPNFDDQLRSQTSLLLALEGKTERAIEATLRVLGSRFTHEWKGTPEAQAIEGAYEQARPSGPYTLQCMMPNVAAGRAALHLNLNGPNFVIDAGPDSLKAAISAAGWLLRSGTAGGTNLAIVSHIFANRWLAPCSTFYADEQEFGVAYCITTRKLATDRGWPVVCSVDEIQQRQVAEKAISINLPREGILESSPDKSKSEFELHFTDWIQSPLTDKSWVSDKFKSERCLVLVHADLSLVKDLEENLGQFCKDHRILLVGLHAQYVREQLKHPRIQALPIDDESCVQALSLQLNEFSPNLVLAIAKPNTWEPTSTTNQLTDNSLCEVLFTAAKHLASSINEGKVEVWGLFPAAWDDFIHPITGSIAGMIKAIKREMPQGRMGVISHRSASISTVLQSLARERLQTTNDETEIVYDLERRLVRRLRPIPDHGVPYSHAPIRCDLNSESVVLATGGARGVTSVMVETLLRDYGCTVIAWGRSAMQQGPLNPDSPEAEREYYSRYVAEHPGVSPAVMKRDFRMSQAAWETFERVTELSKLPGQIRYMQVDVNDAGAVERGIAALQAEFGRIDLIVHGAGMQFSKKLQDRTLTDFRQTYGIKVGGLANLITACQIHFGKLVPVHALTSAYSIFGNDGQHDYGAANETLDRMCELVSSRRDSFWSSLAWSAWDGIGMTRGSEYQALALQRNLALLHPPEGSQFFRRVISGATQAPINIPLSQAERLRYRVRTLPSNPLALAHQSIELPIQLSDIDYLEHHKTSGMPTLPGAWIVEQMVRAILTLADRPVRYVTVENIRFRRFVRAKNPQNRSFRVIADATPEGYSAWLVGDIISPTGVPLASDQVFASAFLSLNLPNATLQDRLSDRNEDHYRSVVDPYCNGDETVQLSGPFECLQHIQVGPKRRYATFAPKIGSSWHDVIPSLLLDAAIRVAGMHVVHDALHVPTVIRRVILPVGVSTQSLENAQWLIHASNPVIVGNDIRCGRVEVTDEIGSLRMLIEDAVVTKLQS